MTHSPQVKTNVLFSNALSVFLTRFFPSLASTLVILYFSKNLSKELYGSYQNFWIQLYLIYPIACFGIHVLVITYKPAVLIKLREYVSASSYFFYGIWIILLSAVFAIMQYYSLHLPLAISFLYLFSFALSFIFESVLIVFRNFKTLISVSALYSSAFLFFHWYVLHHGYSLKRLFLFLLIISVLRFIIYFVVTLTQVDKQKNEEQIVELPVKNIRSLWLHLGAYDIVQNLFNWIDKFIISILLTAPVSAIYFNGTQNIPFLALLLSATSSAVLLQLGVSEKDDITKHSILLVNQSSKLLSSIIFPVFFFLVLFRYEVFNVLFSGKYTASVPVFLMTILVLPVRAYSFTTILQNRHKGAIINMVSLADLVFACILMYPLYRLMGLPGLALSFVITTYLQAIVYLFYTARLLNVKVLTLIPCINWGIKLIVFALCFITIHYVLRHNFTGLFTLILGVVFCLLCITIALLVEMKMIKAYEEKV